MTWLITMRNNPVCIVSVSSIIMRNDKFDDKPMEANVYLKQVSIADP